MRGRGAPLGRPGRWGGEGGNLGLGGLSLGAGRGGCESALVIEILCLCEDLWSLSASENLGADVYTVCLVWDVFLHVGVSEGRVFVRLGTC